MSEEEQVEPRVVEAVFTSANNGGLGDGRVKSPLAKLIEKAMADAVTASYAEGITDPNEMRERMLQARADAKAKYAAAVEEALENAKRAG